MKKRALIVIVFLISIKITSQVNKYTFLPNVLPTSPQATEFIKYGEIPVQTYTGVPNISVPIYTLKTSSINIITFTKYINNCFLILFHPNFTNINSFY